MRSLPSLPLTLPTRLSLLPRGLGRPHAEALRGIASLRRDTWLPAVARGRGAAARELGRGDLGLSQGDLGLSRGGRGLSRGSESWGRTLSTTKEQGSVLQEHNNVSARTTFGQGRQTFREEGECQGHDEGEGDVEEEREEGQRREDERHLLYQVCIAIAFFTFISALAPLSTMIPGALGVREPPPKLLPKLLPKLVYKMRSEFGPSVNSGLANIQARFSLLLRPQHRVQDWLVKRLQRLVLSTLAAKPAREEGLREEAGPPKSLAGLASAVLQNADFVKVVEDWATARATSTCARKEVVDAMANLMIEAIESEATGEAVKTQMMNVVHNDLLGNGSLGKAVMSQVSAHLSSQLEDDREVIAQAVTRVLSDVLADKTVQTAASEATWKLVKRAITPAWPWGIAHKNKGSKQQSPLTNSNANTADTDSTILPSSQTPTIGPDKLSDRGVQLE